MPEDPVEPKMTQDSVGPKMTQFPVGPKCHKFQWDLRWHKFQWDLKWHKLQWGWMDGFLGWSIDWLIHLLTGSFIGWLIDWFIHWLTDRFTGSLMGWLAHSLTLDSNVSSLRTLRVRFRYYMNWLRTTRDPRLNSWLAPQLVTRAWTHFARYWIL